MMRAIRTVLLLIALSMIGAASYAQSSYAHLRASLDAQEPQSLPEKLIKKDLNDNPASVVLVSSSITGLQFDGNVMEAAESQGIDDDSYIYYVYITAGTKRLTIKHNSYVQTIIEFPRTVGSCELWNMTVTGIDAQNLVEGEDVEYKRDVIIKIEPWARLYVDEALSHNVKSLEEGTHYIVSRYHNTEYSQKVNIQKDNQEIDARLGGEVVVKMAKELAVTPLPGTAAPAPNVVSDFGNLRTYDGMLGHYQLNGKPNVATLRTFKKIIEVDSRSHTVLNLDDTVPYMFLMYHATYPQYLGFELARCGKLGFFLSVCCDYIKKINTSNGVINFVGSDSDKTYKSTVTTVCAGPMFRLYRKLYLQAGAGWVKYLSTGEAGILTADSKYRNGFAANADLILRINSFSFGTGYKRMFLKDAYNPELVNQFSLSVGIALGL